MNLVGFLCNRNGVENGYLRRCLHSMSLVSDHIVTYDDFSDEDVAGLYAEYGCTVIQGTKQAFERELYHKQDLLTVALRYRPDWICWFDSDAVLGRLWEDRQVTEQILESAAESGYVRLFLHNLNLYRSPWWYRTDLNYNELWHCVWWKNTGQLHYHPKPGLHQAQYPHVFHDDKLNAQVEGQQTQFVEDRAKLLHYGFVSVEEIALKYYGYRAQGQSGGRLDRLVSEFGMINPYAQKHEEFKLEPVEKDWVPTWLLPEIGEPGPAPVATLDPQQFAQYANFDEWNAARKGTT